MTNFDFLKSDPQFADFAELAISAERIFHLHPTMAVLGCRKALENAVKWMYAVDADLKMPEEHSLFALLSTNSFRKIVNGELYTRINYIRTLGNTAAHENKQISAEQAALCLENLFVFMDFIAYCYGKDYTEPKFDKSRLEPLAEAVIVDKAKLEQEMKIYDRIPLENGYHFQASSRSVSPLVAEKRKKQQKTYVPKPLALSEFQTRKLYIDAQLTDAGWEENKNWFNEVELTGMPNKSERGYADYVLYDDAHRPLALIEAKRSSVDVSKGRQQAKLYADILEKQYGRRPIVFLSNGFETRINDGQYPERKVAAIYSKRDLEKLFNLRTQRTSLKNVMVDTNIAGRYYQKEAITRSCEALDSENKRKVLLVMATGSGKTRTVIALCKVLEEHGWVKNILFLADRTSLVTQAKRAFVNLLPNLSVCNLCEDKTNASARCVFSTYQTMYNCIDEMRDEEGKLFTSGHFDLIICDEAHRSIYNKYKDIFHYFDAPLIGLTATPKDEIDKNTYEIFDLQSGEPTYGYELHRAVKDEYLVPYVSVETKLKFLEEGIFYDELSEEEKEEYENTFTDKNGELPAHIEAGALNEWIFNEDTIRQVLHILMTDGLKVHYGELLGKTILFAKNHDHAEKILEVFGKEYPHLTDYAKVIDNYSDYVQSALDEFSEGESLPRIAISVDMLDTGIDVPEVLNLVFFKKVMSKAKFWQMIGRGTRLCPGLLDGDNKKKFYIFDFCNNFAFFRENKGKEVANSLALQAAIFHLKAQLVCKLQGIEYQTEELKAFRKQLIEEMTEKVREIPKNNFAAKQHLKYVELYANAENYTALTYEDTIAIREELAPLIVPDQEEASAVRFDALLYGIELAYLAGKAYNRAKKDLLKKVTAVAEIADIPEIAAKSELIQKLLHTDYLECAGVEEFELIRRSLRELMKYVPPNAKNKYSTNFADDILSVEWNEAEAETEDLKNYREKAEYYIRQHQDNFAIAKLKSNIPLTKEDIAELEKVLWSEVGTKEQYTAEYGGKPLGEFVREIVGLDMNAAKEAFSEFLDTTHLDAKQIYFVNQIVEYIVCNGMMKDLSVLQSAPFTDKGSVREVFSDPSVWSKLYQVIENINSNAAA